METTPKPRYLLKTGSFTGRLTSRRFRRPVCALPGRAGMVNGTRYAHNYLPCVNSSASSTKLARPRSSPAGYRASRVCPPAVFNLIGTIFHTEWSETDTLELGFYRDEQGNATCYSVGSNAPGDFSTSTKSRAKPMGHCGLRVALVSRREMNDECKMNAFANHSAATMIICLMSLNIDL